MARRRRRGTSWELIGLLAVVTIFLVGGLLWLFSPSARGEVVVPESTSLDPALNLQTGLTEDGRPYLGDPDAPVTIYEFGDFQCPHCREFSFGGAEEIKRDYLATGDAKLVWVSVTFAGDESTEAAKAGVCAAEQGMFWEMHDWLFANQSPMQNSGAYSRDRVTDMAEQAGLDVASFESCMGDSATATAVREGMDLATQIGLSSTPSFLIGERLIEGGDVAAIRSALDDARSE